MYIDDWWGFTFTWSDGVAHIWYYDCVSDTDLGKGFKGKLFSTGGFIGDI